MQYFEIVEKLRKHERLLKKDVSGFQLLMLIQDNEVKSIKYYGKTFEVNFIPITYAFEPYVLNEEKLPTFRDGEEILEHWVHCYDAKTAIYVQIEDEYFEVILDILETVE